LERLISVRHTTETKERISKAMKGKKPAGFLILKECRHCGVEMNAPNLGRHEPACAAKIAAGVFPDKSVKQLKDMRRKLRAYGISPADYAAMWSRQGGLCGVCGGDNKRRALSVDHNHSTGSVRGLLCGGCNLMLGYSKDRPSVLRQAATYLERHETLEPDSCECPEFDPFKD